METPRNHDTAPTVVDTAAHAGALLRLLVTIRGLLTPELDKLTPEQIFASGSKIVACPIPLTAVPTPNRRPPIQGVSPAAIQRIKPQTQHRSRSNRSK